MTFRISMIEEPPQAFEADTTFRTRRFSPYRDFGKRCLDVLLVVATIPITLPLLLLLAGLVALDGGRPFYRQKRAGCDGQPFGLLKLRTMVPDAEGHLDTYLQRCPKARREWDETQKLKYDPRVTAIGCMLRKSSLDELPQLWNVLKGDMSLVGPRPMMLDQRALYPGTAYFRLRPGITGLWQVSDRNNTSFAARADYDARYDETLSLKRDIAILFKTVGVVLRGTGY